MAKSSLPSRAPAQFHSQSLSTYDILPERSRRKQQQKQQQQQQQQQQQHSVAILAQDCHKIELFMCRPWPTVVNVSSSFRLSRNEVMTLQGSLSGSASRLHLQSTPYLLLSWISRQNQQFTPSTLRQHQQLYACLATWNTLRQQHLFAVQLRSWSTLRQFRLQRQLCHRHLHREFNLAKVRIEFPRKFPP